jgi:hypothetical protein
LPPPSSKIGASSTMVKTQEWDDGMKAQFDIPPSS